MKNTILYYLLLFALFNVLTVSCSDKKSATISKTYNIQKDFTPTSFILPYELPQKSPTYPWNTCHPRFLSLTKYSFQCSGTNPEADIPLHQKCLGTLHHGLPLVNGKEYIYPRLIDLLNFLQKENKEKIIVIRGHICPKIFSLLDTQEQHEKYLIGAMVKVSSQINWEKNLSPLVKKFYDKKKEEDPLYEIENSPYAITFINQEFKFIIHPSSLTNIMEIEVLYDKEKDSPIKFTEKDIQNYLRY